MIRDLLLGLRSGSGHGDKCLWLITGWHRPSTYELEGDRVLVWKLQDMITAVSECRRPILRWHVCIVIDTPHGAFACFVNPRMQQKTDVLNRAQVFVSLCWITVDLAHYQSVSLNLQVGSRPRRIALTKIDLRGEKRTHQAFIGHGCWSCRAKSLQILMEVSSCPEDFWTEV